MKTFFLITLTILILSSCNQQRVEKYYYPNGKIQMEIEKKGKVNHGRFISYYKNGKKEMELDYVNGIEEGSYRKYMYKGTVLESGNYVQGKREGVFQFYDDFERLIKKATYHNDTLEGEIIEYYSSGEIKVIGYFKNNLYDGTWSYWDKNGGNLGVATFKEGTGVYYTYHLNGILAVECPYKNNKRDGSEKFFTDKGILYAEKIYKDDALIQEIKY